MVDKEYTITKLESIKDKIREYDLEISEDRKIAGISIFDILLGVGLALSNTKNANIAMLFVGAGSAAATNELLQSYGLKKKKKLLVKSDPIIEEHLSK